MLSLESRSRHTRTKSLHSTPADAAQIAAAAAAMAVRQRRIQLGRDVLAKARRRRLRRFRRLRGIACAFTDAVDC